MTVILKTTRPPFLILTPVCVFLAIALAIQSANFDLSRLVWVMVCALLAHIAVNMLNEYHDFRSGLDAQTKRTPYSGGSGSLVAQPMAANLSAVLGWLFLALTFAIGLWLSYLTSWWLLVTGLLGIAIIALYTTHIIKSAWLCLVAPGLCFGPIMIGGSYFALTETLSMNVLVYSLIPFFLVNNLLLLNQFPDAEADKQVGRNHFVIAYGSKISSWVFAVFNALAFATLTFLLITEPKTPWISIGFIGLPLIIMATLQTFKAKGITKKLLPAMRLNVVANLLIPTLLSIGLLI